MWGREEVVMCELMKGGVVVVVVDAEVNNELVVKGDGLKGTGVNPGEGVWSLGAADMSVVGCRAESLS